MLKKWFFLLLFASLTSTVHALKKEKISLKSKYQKVEFVIEDGSLNAIISVQEVVLCNTSLGDTYQKYILYNDECSVSKITKRYNGKKRKIEPIISDYESNGIFSSDAKLCYFEQELSEEGDLIEINYRKTFYDVKYLDKLFFADDYNVDVSTIELVVPKWIKIDPVKWNFNNKIIFDKKTKKGNVIYSYKLNEATKANKYGNEPSISITEPHIIVVVNSYDQKRKKNKLLNSTQDLYNWYYSLVKKIGNKKTDLQPLVDQLTANATDPESKIKNIYYWVQDNIKYLAFEDGIMGFQPESCQKVLKDKYGDCKGMANLTKEMLVLAGFDARLTWIGTNDIPYDYSLPSLMVDNHMICTVIIDDQFIFLDATEKYSDYGNYAYRIQGKEALIEDGDNFIIKKVPVPSREKNMIASKDEFYISDNVLNGTGKTSFSGNRKTYLYNYLSSISESKRKEKIVQYIGNNDKNVRVGLSEVASLERDKNYEVNYTINIENKVLNIGDEIYVNPDIDREFENYKVDKKRDRAIDLGSSYFINKEIELSTPKEYQLDYMPKAIDITTDNYVFNLNYQQTTEGNIIYQKEIQIIDPIISSGKLEKWREHLELLKEFYNDQLIFIKD